MRFLSRKAPLLVAQCRLRAHEAHVVPVAPARPERALDDHGHAMVAAERVDCDPRAQASSPPVTALPL